MGKLGPGFPAGVYIVFLTPAMLAVSTVMAGTNAGVSAAIDHTNGLHDRFAALPMRAALPRPLRRATPQRRPHQRGTHGRSAGLSGHGGARLRVDTRTATRPAPFVQEGRQSGVI